MSDFLLDFRPRLRRSLKRAPEQLRFADDTQTSVVDERNFGLLITHTGEAALWAPYCASDGSVLAVAGRPAFDEEEWNSGATVEGTGGLAAKVLYEKYRRLGIAGLERIHGSCAVIVYDIEQRVVCLVTDICGAFPVFECLSADGPVYGSHPDALAETTGEAHRLDEASLAEFVVAGTVTPPFTYYEQIRASDPGTIYSVPVTGEFPSAPARRRYFEFDYREEPEASETDLAQELADALQRAVRRRTLTRLGLSAVALSGGLDSRAILASAENPDRVFAFCCYNEPNRELRVAEAIARELAVRFLPLQREFDYYAHNAEMGVRISGGMGSFANNHFLGMMDLLKREGMLNLLTGCYCDYLFKGLSLNRRSHWLTRRESLAPFGHEFYFGHFSSSTPLAVGLRERWESRIPAEFQKQGTAAALFQIEARRTFPLCYEGDNQQRVVPQRTTGWYPPVVDRDVMDVYCKIPYHLKLNRSVFRKAVLLILGSRLPKIPDANTGARLDASPGEEWLASRWLQLQRKLHKFRQSVSTEESWPNWHYYVRHSRKLEMLWNRPNSDAMDFFRRVLGREGVLRDPHSYQGDRIFLFVHMLTLKLWLDQRR